MRFINATVKYDALSLHRLANVQGNCRVSKDRSDIKGNRSVPPRLVPADACWSLKDHRILANLHGLSIDEKAETAACTTTKTLKPVVPVAKKKAKRLVL